MKKFSLAALLCRCLLPLAGSALLTACADPVPGEARFTRFAYTGCDARFERPFDAQHEYLNPILAGFNSDPSICRKGDDYFIVTSSFTFWPAIPIWHSRDLVHWRPLGSVVTRPDALPLDTLRFNRAVYAADISYNPHNNTFYVINTCVDGIGNFVVKSRDPFAGEWSDPIPIPEAEDGIDPSFFYDEDGRTYLLHNGAPEGGRQWSSHQALYLWEYDTDRDCVVGERTLLLDGGLDFGARPEWLEGPRIYRYDGRYILLAAEGGTYENHSQIALAADNVRGPYVPCAVNPILTQRDLPEQRPDKVTCTGHADLIDTPDGRWFALFHGCRPYEGNHYNTGREAFLLPVAWCDGGPVILPPGEAVPTVVRMEGVTLEADPEGVRQQHTDFEVETEFRYTPVEGGFAGVALFQNERHNLLFGKTLCDGQTRLVVVRTDGEPAVVASMLLEGSDASAPVTLHVSGRGGRCDLEAAVGRKPFVTVAAEVDVRPLSTHVARGFNGVIIGPYTGRIDRTEQPL